LSRACAVASQEALPGIFDMAEHVFYTGDNHTFPDGDKYVHGQQGEVMGPGTGDEKSTYLAMGFPGNKGYVECLLTELSPSPPVSGVTTCHIALVLHHYYPTAMTTAI
jgi:hypothetical protein